VLFIKRQKGKLMRLSIYNAVIVSAAVFAIATGLPSLANAEPGTHLPPPPAAALPCDDPASTLSAADCARFNEIIRHFDRVSESTLENLAFIDEIQGELLGSVAYLDYLSQQELTELQSLRLQMTLDRLAKFLDALSNILFKINSTQQTITQNSKG
jgi:hypothetical protein